MRPYQKLLGSAEEGYSYVMREGAEPLGGTIPYIGRLDLKRRVCELAEAASMPSPVLHTTISLPKGLHAAKKVWLKIASAALRAMGIDPDTVPWFAARHKDSTCDHIHILAVCQTFSGRAIIVTGSAAKSEAAHRQLCHLAGLPQPEYFDEKAGPRLVPVTPIRRLTNAPKRQLHADLQHVFLHHQPEDLDALNRHLAKLPNGFKGEIAETGHGTKSILWQSQGSEFFSGELGTAWAPRFIRARFQFSQALRALRHELDLRNLANIFNTPTMEKVLAQTILAVRASAASKRSRDDNDPALADRSARDLPAPVDRPVVEARGSEGNAEREVGGIADRSDPDIEQFSDGTSQAERHTGAPDAGDRGIGGPIRPATDPIGGHPDRDEQNVADTGSGSSDPDGAENRQDAEDVEPTRRLTFAGLLTRISIAAESCAAGWRLKAMHDHRGAAVVFADGSAVKVGAKGVKIAVEGAEASHFVADYAAQFGAPNLVDAVAEMENEPDQDDTPSF